MQSDRRGVQFSLFASDAPVAWEGGARGRKGYRRRPNRRPHGDAGEARPAVHPDATEQLTGISRCLLLQAG